LGDLSVLRSRVGGVVGGFEAFGRDVGVDLCRRKAGVAEEGLDAAEIGTVVEEVGGEAVADFVGGEVGGETGLDEAGFDHGPDGTRGEAFAGFVNEERAVVNITGVAVARYGFEGLWYERADAFARTFAGDARGLANHIDIGDVEADEFRKAHSGGVKKFDDGGIACGRPGGGLIGARSVRGGLDEGVDLSGGEEAGELLFELRQRDFAEDVFRNEAAHEKEFMECAHGGKAQPHTGAGLVAFHQIQHPRAVVRCGEGFPSPVRTELSEFIQRRAVGGNGARRGVFLSVKPLKKIGGPAVGGNGA